MTSTLIGTPDPSEPLWWVPCVNCKKTRADCYQLWVDHPGARCCFGCYHQ